MNFSFSQQWLIYISPPILADSNFYWSLFLRNKNYFVAFRILTKLPNAHLKWERCTNYRLVKLAVGAQLQPEDADCFVVLDVIIASLGLVHTRDGMSGLKLYQVQTADNISVKWPATKMVLNTRYLQSLARYPNESVWVGERGDKTTNRWVVCSHVRGHALSQGWSARVTEGQFSMGCRVRGYWYTEWASENLGLFLHWTEEVAHEILFYLMFDVYAF